MSSTLCACCGQPFEPRPQVPDQAYCASPNCQRARKRQWQRAKLQSDSDYRINQRAAQQACSQRNPDYWRNYRDARPEYAQCNREQQQTRDQGENTNLAKMDVCGLPTGLYRIARHPAFPMENSLVELISVGQNASISRINEKLSAFPDWDAASIETRHGMLIALAQEVWKITPIEV